MEEYSIYEVDFEKGILKTLEGRKFAIDVFDIPIMAGWCPMERITLMKAMYQTFELKSFDNTFFYSLEGIHET